MKINTDTSTITTTTTTTTTTNNNNNNSELDNFKGAVSFYGKQSKAKFQLNNENYLIFYKKHNKIITSIWITDLTNESFDINEIVIRTETENHLNSEELVVKNFKSLNDFVRSFQFCVNDKDENKKTENTNERNNIKLLNSKLYTYFEHKTKFKISFYFNKHCNVGYELDNDNDHKNDTIESIPDRLKLFLGNMENKITKDFLDKLNIHLNKWMLNNKAKFREIFESEEKASIELLNKYCTLVYEYEEIVDLDEDKLIQIEYNIDDKKREKIKELDSNLFQAFQNLQKINFSDNEIDALHPDLLKNLNYLQEIDFSFNSINRIELNLFDSHLEKLTSIKLKNNNIVKLPSNLSEKLKKLENIDASNNQIINLDGNIFALCTNLSEVNFNQNSIRELNRDLFQNSANLKNIWFDKNKISFLPYGFFRGCNHETTKLTEISFARNDIEKLEASIFRGLVNLEKIDFSFNKISELSPDIFVGLKKLLNVDFSHNNITRLHPEILDENQENNQVKIDFRCDYKSLNIFSTWDYQRVYDEFFSLDKTSDKFEMRKDVFDQYLIMICLSKHEITLDGSKKLTDLKEYFGKLLKEKNEINYFDDNNLQFTLLDFFLMCNGISTKMLLNILDKVEKNHKEFPFKVTTQDSIDHLCKHGNEELIIRIDKYFEISEENNFKHIFKKVSNESSAIGFIKIFWENIKKEYKIRDKSKTNFQHIVCKYKFYLNDCLKRCYNAEWWLFFKEILEIHKKEIKDGNFEMAQFYLTIFEKKYENDDQQNDQRQQAPTQDCRVNLENDVSKNLLEKTEQEKTYENFDLRKLENIPVNDHLLNLIKQSKRDDLILHPTTKEFLDQKWKGIPRNLYFFHLVTYIVFIILYLIHLEIIKSSSMRQSGFTIFLNLLLVAISFFFFYEEAIQRKELGPGYWKDNQNKLEMPTYLLCLINTGSILCYNNIKAMNIILYVVTIILLFGILILRFKNIEYKDIGVYTTVFEHIIKKSFRVLPVVVLSLIAFSFAFRVSGKTNEIVVKENLTNFTILESKNKTDCDDDKKEDVIEFYNGTYGYNMIRLLTMSLGEYSTHQMGLFVGLDWATFISNYIAYILFIFILPLLVINMFIGISVDEMRKLIEKSENQNFKNKIEYVLNIQTFLDQNQKLLNFVQENIKLKSVSDRPVIDIIEEIIEQEKNIWLKRQNKIELLTQELKIQLGYLNVNLKNISKLLHIIGKKYYKQENHKKSLEFLQMALVVTYKQTNGCDNTAELVTNIQNYLVCKNEIKIESFMEYFKEIIKSINTQTSSDLAIIQNDIGTAYYNQGKYEDALNHFNEAQLLRNNPKKATILNNIGQVYKSQGKYEEALKYYQKSLESIKNIIPNNSDSEKLLIRIRDVYEIQGNNDKMIEFNNEIIEVRKNRKQIEDTKTNQNKSKRKEPNTDELLNESLDRIRMVEERIKEIHKEVENSSIKQMAQVNEKLLNIQDRFEKRQSDIIEIINEQIKTIDEQIKTINKRLVDDSEEINKKLDSKFTDILDSNAKLSNSLKFNYINILKFFKELTNQQDIINQHLGINRSENE